MSTVLDAAFHLAHDYPGGAAALAPRMGKAHGTLCHELTATGTAKLGLVDALKLSHLTGSRSILNAFASELGCVVLPLPAHHAGIDTFRQIADTAREFGEFITSVADAAGDGQITANELAQAEREFSELVSAGQAYLTRLTAMHQASKPGALREVKAA